MVTMAGAGRVALYCSVAQPPIAAKVLPKVIHIVGASWDGGSRPRGVLPQEGEPIQCGFNFIHFISDLN